MLNNWERPRIYDDPFTSPSLPPKDHAFQWASRVGGVGRASASTRSSGCRISPVRISVLLVTVAFVVFVRDRIGAIIYWPLETNPLDFINGYAANSTELIPFQPPELGGYHHHAKVDTFTTYKYRSTCHISSLDLHRPFRPLCTDRQSMLNEMSSSGRIDIESPYMPQHCEMRWFTTEEICEILGRFERVVLVGDSMLRQVTGSINFFIRRDLGYGAVADWIFSAQERKQYSCNEQFDAQACSVQAIYKTADVVANDPASPSCSNKINLIMEQISKFPIPTAEKQPLTSSAGNGKRKPKAFIFGHGLWNDLDLQKKVDWLDAVLEMIKDSLESSNWNGLFITSNVTGKEEQDQCIVAKGNQAVVLFEGAVAIEAGKRGVKHLGTWNMSIRSTKYDDVLLNMKGNLVKAIVAVNWLNLLDV
ncbi:hypothetical protein BJ875DRAFT_267577 [Amylocarpus encephaloides]|uniref:Uncharacterized protein n=1 Tax=Amylocarpus encephaloides TaxID=45428 RepID=A0A9P7YLT2_9HELO|nr:hypothetical protein BJ875DRAFT_267577 [Amylocarpus encephaloides]